MHGMEPGWCYLCRVEDCGVDPQIVWGIALDEDLPELRFAPGPMTPDVAAYMRFLCEELALQFDPTFTQREAAMVLQSFLTDPATPDQVRTLEHLGEMELIAVTYGAARSKIRRLVALRGLRSA